MAEGKVLPYLDVPFQHASLECAPHAPPRRPEKTLSASGWRGDLPRHHCDRLSSSVPGETEENSPSCSTGWRSRARPGRLLPLRPVRAPPPTSPARRPDEVKEERWHRLMKRQQAISAKRLRRWVGTRQQVLIDAVGAVAKGRTKGDAPEIDGTVYVASRRPLRVGEFATVKIERAEAYDLYGTVVGF
jgi:ribosomal protein S12 methylthiotransferase